MGTHALPDMYALSPWACCPRASGIHIRQSTRAHVITYTYMHKQHMYAGGLAQVYSTASFDDSNYISEGCK